MHHGTRDMAFNTLMWRKSVHSISWLPRRLHSLSLCTRKSGIQTDSVLGPRTKRPAKPCEEAALWHMKLNFRVVTRYRYWSLLDVPSATRILPYLTLQNLRVKGRRCGRKPSLVCLFMPMILVLSLTSLVRAIQLIALRWDVK